MNNRTLLHFLNNLNIVWRHPNELEMSTYCCAEVAVAALQFPGGFRWLFTEAQLAEDLWPRPEVGGSLGGPWCRILGFLT